MGSLYRIDMQHSFALKIGENVRTHRKFCRTLYIYAEDRFPNIGLACGGLYGHQPKSARCRNEMDAI
jgi:hypothetical protein